MVRNPESPLSTQEYWATVNTGMTKRSTIAVAEDDPSISNVLFRALSHEGYEVKRASDGAEALTMLTHQPADLVILDITMPYVDGLEVCRRLRAAGNSRPVLMLTARTEIGDRVAGLDAGADDYLVKPFALDELLARIRALLRRTSVTSKGSGNKGTILQVGDLEIDRAGRTVKRRGQEVALTKTEFDLLELLVFNADSVMRREAIYEAIWGYNFEDTSKSLDVYIGYLRRKIEREDSPRLIQTVRGVGYVLRRP